jgi:type III restriction enzyme
MELKEFQQRVLEAFAYYLDVLLAKKEQSDRQRKLAKENPDAGIKISDFSEEAWNALRAEGKLPSSRDHVPFSRRVDGMGVLCHRFALRSPPAVVRPFWQRMRFRGL